MRKSRFLLGGLVILLTSGPALAMSSPDFIRRHQHQEPEPDATDTSVIVDVQAKSRSIALADGHKYAIPVWIDFNTLKKGETVSIVYTPDYHHGTEDVKTVKVI